MPARGPSLPPIRNLTHKALKQEAQTPLTPFDHVTRTPREPGPRERAEHNHLFSDRVLPLPAPPTAAVLAAPVAAVPATANNTKRTHQAAFDPKARAQEQPLFNGKRPEDDLLPRRKLDTNSDESDEEDVEVAHEKPMTYRRADGTMYNVKASHLPRP
jgi:hypothetical protein